MPSFTTNFTGPADLTGLILTPDLDASKVDLSWDVTSLIDAHFWRYYIYRQNAEGLYERIGEASDKAAPAFSDVEAPHGVTVRYAVTVSNGWAESGQLIGSTLLDLNWWIVDPADPSRSFAIRYVEGGPETEEYPQGIFHPIGKKAPIVVSGELMPPTGRVSVKVPRDNPGYFTQIRRAARTDPYVVLKDPFGNVRRVKLGTLGRDPGQAGIQRGDFSYTTVDVGVS